MKRIKPPYKDKIYNNKRADFQDDDLDEPVVKMIRDKMLYDQFKEKVTASLKKSRQDKINKLQADPKHWSGLI